MPKQPRFPQLTLEQAEKAVRSFDRKAYLHEYEDGKFAVFVGDPKDTPEGAVIKKGKKWETARAATPEAAWNEAAQYLNIMSSNLVLCASCYTFLREGRRNVPHPDCPAWP